MSGIDHKKLSEILGSEYIEPETPEKIQLQPSSTFESPFSKPNTSAKSGMGLKDDPSPPDTIQQLRDQCKRYEEAICTLQKTIDTKADVIEFQDNQIAHLAKQVREQDKRYAEAGSMAAWQQKEVDSLTSRNQNQLKVIDGLRAELAEKAKQLDNAWKTCEERGEELNNLRPEIDDLTKQLDQRTDELTRAQHTVAEALETIDELREGIVRHVAFEVQQSDVIQQRSSDLAFANAKIADLTVQIQAHKPLQWERRLPTQEECDTCIILKQSYGSVIWPGDHNAEDWSPYDDIPICILPAILPAVEPPQKVIQRLWIRANPITGWAGGCKWVDEGEKPEADDAELFWHETKTTREKPQ
jgi:predicted  nucleic acid-binding Zn-ribbon protein